MSSHAVILFQVYRFAVRCRSRAGSEGVLTARSLFTFLSGGLWSACAAKARCTVLCFQSAKRSGFISFSTKGRTLRHVPCRTTDFSAHLVHLSFEEYGRFVFIVLSTLVINELKILPHALAAEKLFFFRPGISIKYIYIYLSIFFTYTYIYIYIYIYLYMFYSVYILFIYIYSNNIIYTYIYIYT